MKFTKTIALALAAGVVSSAAFAQEAEGDLEFGAYAGTVLKNGYLSNGYVFYDDTVLQSYAGVTAGNDDIGTFDLNIWNSWGIGKDSSSYADCDASEIDYELDYSKSIEDFDFMLGVAAWVYPDTDDSFDEWVGKVAVGYNGFVVRPELNARFGLEGQQGCYGQFKLSKNFDLAEDVCEGLSAKVYGLLGAASKSYRKGKGVDKNGLVDVELGATISYELCDNASICAGVQYAIIVDDDLRDAIDSGDAFMASGDKENFMYFVGADIWF